MNGDSALAAPDTGTNTPAMARQSWYRRTREGGVIVRFANRDGVQFKSP